MAAGLFVFLKIALAVSIIVKAYLHAHVAYRNNIALGAGGGLPVKTLWYFRKPVTAEYESLKRICNYLQSANIILLLVVLVISFLI